MWAWLLQVFAGPTLNAIFGGANNLVKTIFGDKAAQQQNFAIEQQAVQASYAAEASAPEKVHFFGRFVDNINRLVRPVYTYGIIALFIYAVYDPHEFSIAMLALTAIPDNLWYLFYTVTAFWFGSRMLQGAPTKMGPPNTELVAQIQNAQDQLDVQKNYEGLMQNTKVPLTNAAIIQWNKLNNPGFMAH